MASSKPQAAGREQSSPESAMKDEVRHLEERVRELERRVFELEKEQGRAAV